MPLGRKIAFALVTFSLISEVCYGQNKKEKPGQAEIGASLVVTDWGHNGIGGLASETVAFLTEDTLAISICSHNCLLFRADISGSEVRPIAERVAPGFITHLGRAGTSGILAWFDGGGHAKLYSIDLQTETIVPRVLRVSGTGVTVAAASASNLIDVYQISDMTKPRFHTSINEGNLMSISDEALLVRRGNELTVEGFDGDVLSSFSLNRKNQCEAEIISKDKIYLDGCGKNTVVDRWGKPLARLQSPGGWGSRLRWSSDGGRILYNHFLREVSPWRSLSEVALAVVTLGMGVADETDNAMAVRL